LLWAVVAADTGDACTPIRSAAEAASPIRRFAICESSFRGDLN
jgi:hypothetical protein